MGAVSSGASNRARQLVLVRHGETEWSREGRHTGGTDIPLTDEGRRQARELQPVLRHWNFSAVYVSPLQRARATCELAGYGGVAVVLRDLTEWDYGAYEGLTTADVRRTRPGWNIWKDGAPGGEPLSDAGARADRVLDVVRREEGDALLVAHGHILRILTARWIEQPPIGGQRFRLQPASPSVLSYEHEWTVVNAWNTGR
jgi:broad specificity phosphatase PhoE